MTFRLHVPTPRNVPSASFSPHFQVLAEHFDEPEQLQDAIICSEECATLFKNSSTRLPGDCCSDHQQGQLDVFCRECETELCNDCVSHSHSTHQCADIATVTGEEALKLRKATDHVMGLLEEMREVVSVVKEMTQRVKIRKERSMERTREVFNVLRKAVDEREEQVIADIKKRADKRENVLKVCCV